MLAASPVSADSGRCQMDGADSAWLSAALAQWRVAETRDLGLPSSPLPTVVAIDAACTYVLPEGDLDRAKGQPHGTTVVLPDGAEAPLGPISFASGEGGYFAMSLPSVWREAGVTSPFGLEALMDGVLLHEMMHIRQVDLAKRTLDGAAQQAGIADDDLTDDVVQDRFEDEPGYIEAYAAERDALFAAAAAPSDAEARVLVAQALGLMRERRARWFTGDKAAFARFDDVFLTMEGMGQWLIYRHFLALGHAPGEALPAVRRGGRRWSQDEGLALMLVVDRLLPGWQARAFRDPEWRAANLLEAALARQGPSVAAGIQHRLAELRLGTITRPARTVP
jgi:hypothetical protein